MIWLLVMGVCFSLLILLIPLVWTTSSRPGVPPGQTLEQCRAALCVFRLLMDMKEEDYLRARLSPSEFQVLQRKRLWLALRYLMLLGKDATLLASTGQRAGRLAFVSLQLKANILAAEAAVAVKWLRPSSPLLGRFVNRAVHQRTFSLIGL